MRLFTATLATETNTFSPCRPASRATASRCSSAPASPGRCAAHVHGAAVRRPARAAAEGFELIEGSCFAASPAAPPTAPTTDHA